MNCPKCGYTNQPDSTDCCRCGVIFAKIISLTTAADGGELNGQATTAETPKQSNLLRELLFGVPDEVNSLYVWGRAIVLVGIAIWGSKLIFSSIASNTAGESLLHLINLPFHEAGHLVFRPFGTFAISLGGTLGQLAIPLVCFCALLFKTRDAFGAAICLWWFGENFLDIAPYINDARAGALPLVAEDLGEIDDGSSFEFP